MCHRPLLVRPRVDDKRRGHTAARGGRHAVRHVVRHLAVDRSYLEEAARIGGAIATRTALGALPRLLVKARKAVRRDVTEGGPRPIRHDLVVGVLSPGRAAMRGHSLTRCR